MKVNTFLQPSIVSSDCLSKPDAILGHDWQEVARTAQRKAEQIERLVKVGSFEVDLKTDALTWSNGTYAIFGLPFGIPVTVEQALGCYDVDIQHEITRHLAAAAASGEPYDLTVPFRSMSGNVGWVRMFAQVDTSGGSRRVIGVIQDITRERETEERLRRWRTRTSSRACRTVGRSRHISTIRSPSGHTKSWRFASSMSTA